MSDLYIQAGSPTEWVRPGGWPAMPNITSADNKFAGVYAVYDRPTNKLAIQVNSVSAAYNVDWGDGSAVQFFTGLGNQIKSYVYSSITAPILVDVAGNNYKPVLVIITNTGTAANLDLSRTRLTTGQAVDANWLENLISWNSSVAWSIRPLLLQKINFVKGPLNASALSLMTTMPSLSVFEGEYFKPGNTGNISTIQAMLSSSGSFQLNMPDFEMTKSGAGGVGAQAFINSNLIKFGSLTLNNFTVNNDFFNGCRNLTEVGNITLNGVTNASNFFLSCFSLKKIGLINITSVGFTAAQMFNGALLLTEIIFNDASKITNSGSMFLTCRSLNVLRLPGMLISFSVTECNLERDEILDLLNDLGTPAITQNITLTRNPGLANLTIGEINAILVPKNWTYTP